MWEQVRDVQGSRPEMRAEAKRLTGMLPGFLSGLVCAGANGTPHVDREDGLLTAEDVAEVALELPENSSAAVALFEHRWALGLQWAVRAAGGQMLGSGFINPAAQAEVSAKLLNATPNQPLPPESVVAPETARLLGVTGLIDILVFFGVLLVGFAYVWYRGDLDWVRAVRREPADRSVPTTPPPGAETEEPVLSS